MTPSRVIVPVSGGKDSQVCVALAVSEWGSDKVLMVHNHTGFDHLVTYEHMAYMAERYGVPLENIHSDKYTTVPEVMHGEQMIPNRYARTCTRILKHEPWQKWLVEQPDHDTLLVVLGMRADESAGRRSRYGGLSTFDWHEMGDLNANTTAPNRKVPVQLPIADWTTPEVFEFLRERGDKINPLYERGHKRVGCYPCVLAGSRDWRLAARDPIGRQHLEAIHKAVIEIQVHRPESYLDNDHDIPKLLEGEFDPFGLDDADDFACPTCSI